MVSLDEALATIDKKFGKGTVIRYGDLPKYDTEVVSTGIATLDTALGIGGLPKGRIIEIYGPEASGKTTLALHVLAECQIAGGKVAFIDMEHALDPNYATHLGVDMDDVLFSQPDSGEQALEVTEELVRSEEVAMIVIDSVAALVPRAELEGEMGAASVGVQARLMSQALRKLTAITSKAKCTIIFINQLRDKIGVTWGSPETTTGGKALKYYASVRLDVRRIGALKNGEDIIGNQTKVKIVKNKLSAPHKEVTFDLIFGEGFSKELALLDLAVEKGIITKKSAWFAYKEANFAQGRENARKELQKPEFYEEVKALAFAA
jgi:recombination protein RecA